MKIIDGWFGRTIVVAAAALAGACTDYSPIAPVNGAQSRASGPSADIASGNRLPDLTACPQLAAPRGSTLQFQALGVGVQIYSWNGTSWQFVAPKATLYADAGQHAAIADHFGGPTWQFVSGGSVVGTLKDKCSPDAASIPWLSLTAVAEGPGAFSRVNFIQRLNTVGGNAPSTPGATVGQVAKVPYTANYLFYNAPVAN